MGNNLHSMLWHMVFIHVANSVFREYMIVFTHIDFEHVVPATYLKCCRICSQIFGHPLFDSYKHVFLSSMKLYI